MLLTNFLLSKAKRELSPQLTHLAKGTVNHTIKKVIKEIDCILFEHEGMPTKEFLTPRRYQVLEVILSYLVQEGYSQVSQKRLSEKSGISLPLINETLQWLEDLEICHQIKTRRHGKIAPSIYILSLHTNYLKIIAYFKQKWAYTIDMFATFTEFLSKKVRGNATKKTDPEEACSASICQGVDLFTPMETAEMDVDVQDTTTVEDHTLKLRFQEMDKYMNDDQKKLYLYILTQDTHITEKDAYTIALRMPSDIDLEVRKTFEECVRWFQFHKADVSTPAHFITMYTKKLHAYRKIRTEKYKNENESRVAIDFKKFNEMLTPHS
ncbi:Replicase RepFR55 [Bacillus cereus]|uniref:Replicase RepFR55 n=1 Tax=Bacillus cereus TaxID=1396 RepID=A0AAW5KTN5_BACCE|nr:Replicase RepFR55 [Bacillus cereus]MCQ6284540.1 Replicase RepFR55 [Bacillus cereus]MCQ6314193.1 Replicase RepFR55 [Bacillus cereus]MCQ6329950.1 Replicase RepFR55 [Bacillus cereus]MCQ6383983.1 Replicase RepFR55 [Bacillus cereus]